MFGGVRGWDTFGRHWFKCLYVRSILLHRSSAIISVVERRFVMLRWSIYAHLLATELVPMFLIDFGDNMVPSGLPLDAVSFLGEQ